MLEAKKKAFIEAASRLADNYYLSVVSLILAVPIERKDRSPLQRAITGNGANGYRTPQRPTHNGIDFNAGPYAEGYAQELNILRDGAVVTRSEFNSSYGNVIDITATVPCKVQNKNAKLSKLTFRYAHLHKRFVNKGDKLSLWQPLGTVGSTGDSTGAHLHFEVWVDGKRINPNDLKYLSPIVDKPTYHIVQKSDTYGKISVMYGIPVADLRKWNGWEDMRIPLGAKMWLIEPPTQNVPDPEPPVRPDEPPHPVEPEVDLEILKLEERIKDLEDELATVLTKLNGIKNIL